MHMESGFAGIAGGASRTTRQGSVQHAGPPALVPIFMSQAPLIVESRSWDL
jgi:hypothetical protein